MPYETLLYETGGGVAVVTLNRPDKMNAFNSTMGREMVEAFKEAERDPDVRAIIMTGAGKAFCAGADIGGFAREIKARETATPRERSASDGREMLAFPNLVR